MNNSGRFASYALSRHTRWAVEENFIYMINTATGKSLHLSYPEAAFFDLFSRNYRFDQVVAMVARVDTLTLADTYSLGIELLEKWTRLGFFEKQESPP